METLLVIGVIALAGGGLWILAGFLDEMLGTDGDRHGGI